MREQSQQEGSGVLRVASSCGVLLVGIKSKVFMWAIILFGDHHVQIISMPKMSLFMVKGTEDPVV